MAKGRKGLGVEALATSIRFSFTLNGESFRETVHRAPTPANMKWANRVAADVRRAIEANAFRFEDFFPESKHALRATGDGTLGHYLQLFLDSITDKSANTRAQYGTAVRFWRAQLGAETLVAKLRHSELKAFWGKHPWKSWKQANNYLIVLRGALALAVGDNLVPKSPLDGVENKARPASANEPPDPFTDAEVELILDLLQKRHERVWHYFEFAFFTGMRPEEIIELRWGDVDQRAGIVRITRARSLGEVRPPKNGMYRDVELHSRALAALKRAAWFTRAKPGNPYVFENPRTGSPWNSTASQRDHYWNPVIKALGLRARTPYNTRHTCASRMLAAGCKPGWCASQLGHSLEMFFRVYAKWVNGVDRGSEMAKLEEPILPAIFHDVTPEGKNLSVVNGVDGRRDWTRTKSPESEGT
jgi:integrase